MERSKAGGRFGRHGLAMLFEEGGALGLVERGEMEVFHYIVTALKCPEPSVEEKRGAKWGSRVSVRCGLLDLRKCGDHSLY